MHLLKYSKGLNQEIKISLYQVSLLQHSLIKLQGNKMARVFHLSILLISITLLAGCVSFKEIYLADGSKGYNVNCSGSGMNYSHCLEKAGEICSTRGYQILNQQGEVVSLSNAVREFEARTKINSVSHTFQSGAIASRNLFIKCKQ